MRSRSSSNQHNKGMEVERPKGKEEPQLSGAYIRTLVKQLSSCRTKENPKSPSRVVHGNELSEDPAIIESHGEAQQLQPPPQPKKQVRRRLHTSRPYQERLLNMAEARREIVTALKFHRAAMKQASEQHQQQQTPPPPPPRPPRTRSTPMEEPHQVLNPTMYSTNSMLPNYFHYRSLQPFTYHSPLSWPYHPITPFPVSDSLNLPLPNQRLGLNLNFQGFNNIKTPLYNNKPPFHSSASPLSSSSSYSYSSPSPPPTMSSLEVPFVASVPPPASETAAILANSTLHPVMDDEEIADIRTLGEQHDMEWNDTVNLVTSAWWSKFFKNMELDAQEGGGGRYGDGFGDFDDLVDIPAWLSDGSGGSANESCLLPQRLDAAALPCLDMRDIDGE